MRETSARPIRQSGWAFQFLPVFFSRPIHCPRFLMPWFPFVGMLCLAALPWSGSFVMAGNADHGHDAAVQEQGHQHAAVRGELWEGSRQGIAYSEFNHHMAGVFLLLIGLSEVRQALGWPALVWTRFLLPGALTVGGIFLLIWSDHDSWPIGSMTFAQTFFGSDEEVLQHKTYGVLAFVVGVVEFLRRTGWFAHAVWAVPLPLFAIVGGLMLFSHSHGDHPAASTIVLHHVIMGMMAITAGSSKLVSGWRTRSVLTERSYWELLWASLVVFIGLQLLIYSE